MSNLKPGNEVEPPAGKRVPITYVPQPSFRHLVEDGETWETVAAKFGMNVQELILANFKTLVPQEINWYLHHYVECNVPTTDRYNWRFSASARKSGNPRAGVIFIPMKPVSVPTAAPPAASNGLDQLAKDTAEMKKDLEEIKKHIAKGQAVLRDLQCSLLFEAYKKYNTNRSLKYLSGEELRHLPEFIECMIITSRQVGPFLNKHPRASNFTVSSPLGDMASSLTPHDDISFASRMASRGFTVDANSRGLYDWKDRSIHLQMGATLGHAIHEGIHSFSSFTTVMPVFLSTLGSFLYEGVTQVFTDQVLSDFQWDAANHGYKDEVSCAQQFIRDFTPIAVANGYFRQQIVPLAEAVARKLGINLNDLRIMKDVRTDGRTGRHLCEKLGYI
jgi:hypothetical protein